MAQFVQQHLQQALLNLGAVLQLLPITGVPLPLVSYGGSSLVPTMVALGMLMSFARHETRSARSARSLDLRNRAAPTADLPSR